MPVGEEYCVSTSAIAHPASTTSVPSKLGDATSGRPTHFSGTFGAFASNGVLPCESIRRSDVITPNEKKRRTPHSLDDESWAANVGRYGLTSHTVSHDFTLGSVPRPVQYRPSSFHPSPSIHATSSPRQPLNIQGKRPPDEETSRSGKLSSSPSKKPRTRLVPPRDIDLSSVPGTPGSTTPKSAALAAAYHKSEEVTSPLFFSSSPKPMSNRPPVLPPTDSAAALLARLREDAEGVHTVRLARGNVSSVSPARSGSTSGSGSWSSIEQSAGGGSSRSPASQFTSPALQVLNGVGVIELLEQDERPTFIIDLANPINANRTSLHLMYANASLRASGRVLELLSVEGDDALTENPEYAQFKAWVSSCVKGNESMDVCLPSHQYGGITWSCSTLRKRFRFISGSIPAASPAGRPNEETPIAHEAAILEERTKGPTPSPNEADVGSLVVLDDGQDYFGNADSVTQTLVHLPGNNDDEVMSGLDERHHSDEFTNTVLQAGLLKPSFDWTRIATTPDMPPHILFARTTDWAETALGPIAEWRDDLRSMANMIMGSPHPAALYWGPEFTTLYNEAYIELAGQKHPTLMGMGYAEAWPEIWSQIRPAMDAAWETGQSTMKNDNQLFIHRHGFLEETFFSWSLVPLVGSEGQVVGIYNPAFENTRRKVNERRMLTLREVGERTASARDVKGFWPRVEQGLAFNELDVPLAVIYSVKEENESDMASMHSGTLLNPPQVQLEGTMGVPGGHHAAPSTIDLKTSDEGFAPYMRQSLTGEPVVLSEEDGTLPRELIDGLDWKGFGDPSRTVVVIPVYPTTKGEAVVGFIIMGTNPRRPYDDDYKLFIHLMSRQLATSLASVVLFEEEIKRGQQAANRALRDRTFLEAELKESEYKFTRMAAFAPVGMFIADPTGKINFANDMWWRISGHPRTESGVDTWMQSVRDEDRPALVAAWESLLTDKKATTLEFRFNCSRQTGDHVVDTWVLMSAYPEKESDGSLKSIFGCITDISTQKWAEYFQIQRREEAVELKRQQENFIDITSHEMRNPLSAIVHCADEISNTIADYQGQLKEANAPLQHLLEKCTEASSTINLCASHQHRIVDDILTLSKLDSQLLLVTPADAQPVELTRNVLKMFESEVNTHDITLDFDIAQPIRDLGIDWVKIDPPRLQQVLINLMTNAIKFTQKRETRRISVTLTASRDISEVKGATYFPSRRDDLSEIARDKDWGDGEEINLHFSVQDTGPGLQEDEKKLLFQRFSQASPRTHVKYGGSGLGLFISRMLTELQGGQIGVVSEMGQGSTFSFYVKCRKTNPPGPEEEGFTLPILDAATQGKSSMASAPTKAVSPGPAEKRKMQLRANLTKSSHDVLIVEDNIVNQKVLQRQLKSCGNTTHVANHGGEALKALEGSRFWTGQESSGYNLSIILMDLEMPVMDGMTCAKNIRELEKAGKLSKHIPIIAVTAYARPEQIEDARAAGIDAVISKPFRIPELTAKIDELIVKCSKLSEE